jgi:diguanylate cyclase (GGDEF)-like protein
VVNAVLYSTSTDIVIGIVAGGATALAALLVIGFARVRRTAALGSGGAQVTEVVQDLNSRIEEMGRELSDALERAREETRRSRALGELAGSIDLEDVLRRTLDAAAAIPGADGAVVTVQGTNGDPVTVAVGLTDQEVHDHSVGHLGPGRRVRSMAIAFPAQEATEGGQPAISAGLAVPVVAEGEPIGMLAVFSRGDPDRFSESQLLELEDLAAGAAPAIENARRFRIARQLADFDALTSLHNRRYFHETLGREVARAQRYTRRLSLLVIDLDDFKAINDQLGHLAGDAVLTEVAERIRTVIRSADVPCRVGGDEFAVILPESTLDDAEQLYRRLQAQLAEKPVALAGHMLISAGIAELRPQEDALAFFQRADDALYRAKESGKGRVEPAPGAPPAASGVQA